MEPVRLAAVGLGRWGHVLASAYGRSPKVRLVTCFTRTPEKRARFAERFGCDQDDSLEAVLARDDVEAVIVTVPNEHHAGVIEQAAAAGKHVFVEKPIAVELSHARRIQQVVQESGIKFLCGHSARRLGGLRKMKRMLESGEVGGVSTVEAVFSNERGLELEPGNWRGDPLQTPGGPLTQLGVHQIDNLQFLLGPVKRVFNFGKPMYTRVENDTVNSTVMELEAGQLAYLGTNWACPGVFQVSLYATRADLFYQLDFSWWSNSDVTDQHSTLRRREFASMRDDPDDRVLREVAVDFERTDHLKDEVEDLAQAIRDGKQPEVSAEDGMRNLAVVLAAVLSSRESRVVEVEEVLAG